MSTAVAARRRRVGASVLRCFGPKAAATASGRRGVSPLTEDRSLFDGPRATYGRFHLLHQIGAGSVGPVFRGEDGETRQRVVIKVIRVGLPPEKVAVLAASLAALKARWPAHPGLAPMIETGVVDVEPYVVTPWVDGDSLDVALREYGPAHLSDALPRLRRLADALDTAASAGWHHGSLHLRDIIVSVEQTVLTGMGIAPLLAQAGVRPPVRRPYSAPEVVHGGPIGPGTDQYALAAIAHEWLSGRRLSGSGAAGFHVPASTPAGADALRHVFERALADDPDDRYPSAAAFVDALEARAGDVPERRTTRSGRRTAAIDVPRFTFDDGDDVAAAESRLSFAPAVEADADADVALHGAAVQASVVDIESRDVADGHDVDRTAPAASGPQALGDDEAAGADLVGDLRLDVDGSAGADDELVVDEPVLAGGGPSLDDDEPVVRTPYVHRDAPSGAPSAGAAADEARRAWAMWAAGLVLAVLTIVGGGWFLLRWGTPAVAPGGRPASTATATAASTTPPVTAGTVPAPVVAPPAPMLPAMPVEPSPVADAAAITPDTSAAALTPAPAAPAAGRPAPAPTPTGRLLVRSTPAGADVVVNGERRGVTPLTLRGLAAGTYAVRVSRAGFTTAEQRVVLNRARPSRSLDVTLRRVPATRAPAPARLPAPRAAAPAPGRDGSLVVDSRPSGARVVVDGRAVGVTPVTIPALSAGTHTVRIERAGYAPVATTTRVEPGARARVAVTLTAERPDR